MADLEVVEKEGSDFVVKVPNRETSVKIEDTFADTCHYCVIGHSVLGKLPLFL